MIDNRGENAGVCCKTSGEPLGIQLTALQNQQMPYSTSVGNKNAARLTPPSDD